MACNLVGIGVGRAHAKWSGDLEDNANETEWTCERDEDMTWMVSKQQSTTDEHYRSNQTNSFDFLSKKRPNILALYANFPFVIVAVIVFINVLIFFRFSRGFLHSFWILISGGKCSRRMNLIMRLCVRLAYGGNINNCLKESFAGASSQRNMYDIKW